MTTRTVLVFSAVLFATALAGCHPDRDKLLLVGEIYYPTFASSSTTRVLVRAPASSIASMELGKGVDVSLALRGSTRSGAEIEFAAKGTPGEYVSRMYVLGVSDDGSEVWLKVPTGTCSGSFDDLGYQPGKTKVVNVLMRPTTGNRLEVTTCAIRETISREPIRLK